MFSFLGLYFVLEALLAVWYVPSYPVNLINIVFVCIVDRYRELIWIQ